MQTPWLHGSEGHDGDGPNTSKQVPGSGPTLHVRHWPQDATTQQTPSVQNPEAHSVPPAQVLPRGFGADVVVVVVDVEVVVVGAGVVVGAAQPPDGPRTWPGGQTVVPGEQVPGGRQRELVTVPVIGLV
jgi:hypothetical protein